MKDPERITYFGATDSRGKRKPFGIKAKDRSRHMYVIGKTGMGKSNLLENMAIQDIQNGEGMAFIDPHGSAAEKLLDYVPKDRVKDVLYFAPFDMDYPIGFNIMEDVGYDKRHLVVAGLMSTFKKIWVDAWSARMEYILENTLLALLEYPDSTLLDINKMLINKSFRKKVVEKISDPLVKSFWTEEFAKYTDRYTQEATPAIQNKVGQFTSNPLIRNIVGQPKSSFDMRKIMDERKILIANLSKGRMGEKNASMLGSILTTKLYLSAMSRAEESAPVQQQLPDFYFYVDEFQSIANETFANILSEARKYKLNLIIAHQYIEQMEEDVRDAVFGNVGTTITFRVGPFDAEVLETIFKPTFFSDDLVNLGMFQIYLTLMIDGIGSPPFSAVTLPPIEPPRTSYREEVTDSSRKKYTRSRSEVEKEIQERMQVAEEEQKQPLPQQTLQRGRSGQEQSRGQKPKQEWPKQQKPIQNRQQSRQQEPKKQEPSRKTVLSQLEEKTRVVNKQQEKKVQTPTQRASLRDALAAALVERQKEHQQEKPQEIKKQEKPNQTSAENEKKQQEESKQISTKKEEIQSEELKKILQVDEDA